MEIVELIFLKTSFLLILLLIFIELIFIYIYIFYLIFCIKEQIWKFITSWSTDWTQVINTKDESKVKQLIIPLQFQRIRTLRNIFTICHSKNTCVTFSAIDLRGIIVSRFTRREDEYPQRRSRYSMFLAIESSRSSFNMQTRRRRLFAFSSATCCGSQFLFRALQCLSRAILRVNVNLNATGNIITRKTTRNCNK